MKKLLVILLCVLLTAVSFAACGSNEEAAAPPAEQTPVAEETNAVEEAALAYFANFPADRHVISPADFFTKIDAGEEMFIIDIRSADDYAKGHIKGAVNLPFGNGSIAQNLEIIPDDVSVYVYCYTGQTASQTTAVLNVAGKPAYNVQSGFVRGISVEPNFENYLSTDPVDLPADTYEVNSDIKAAVEEYYATVASYAGTPTEAQNIKVENVKEIVDSESDDYMIVSVRKAEDYAKGHVKGAVNIPFGAGMQDSLVELPKDKKIIVYCYTGQTASQTVAILRLLGYEAYNMQFGMGSVETKSGWLGAGFETVTE
ncbi:rhodanese-like domain-containing protein [Clostridiales bacterium BAD-6]|uniref:Rhodanese-like domain-containing protein n=1 Tax=Sinanaerobacter chloroacetimidivorans TaxID=2818044 RepID=A0A8J7W060_9FIRM|nr:rhodanese-like domain-containing protein [Sinanaerobacter chloroacetimidivorans]